MLQLSIFFQKNSKAVLVFVSYVICLRCDVNTNYEGVVLTFFFSSFNSISIICSRLNLNSHIYVVCPMLCWVLLCVLYPNSKKKRFCYGFAVLLLYCRLLSFLVAICSWHIVWLFSLGELHYITAQNALSWHDEKNCIIYLKKKVNLFEYKKNEETRFIHCYYITIGWVTKVICFSIHILSYVDDRIHRLNSNCLLFFSVQMYLWSCALAYDDDDDVYYFGYFSVQLLLFYV